jgi:hypothetical protein
MQAGSRFLVFNKGETRGEGLGEGETAGGEAGIGDSVWAKVRLPKPMTKEAKITAPKNFLIIYLT